MMNTVRFVDLHYQAGGSDKVYHVAIQEEGGSHIVAIAYGRRGSGLQYGTKTASPLDLEKATKVYDKAVAEKVGKGYRESPGVSGNIFGTKSGPAQTAQIPVKKSSGVVPQLCNECSEEEAEGFIADPAWGMQEKKDGVHKLVKTDGPEIQGINKKGEFVPLPQELVDAAGVFDKTVTLDGEQIGNVLHAFGLLELNGENMRGHRYIDVYRVLEAFLARNPSPALSLVPLAVTSEGKRALFNQIKAEGKEGVVFKRLAAPYSPGKPASGGDHLKFKFWSDVSVIVIAVNNKRSIQMGVLSDGAVLPVGNVTIPVNKDIPVVGDVVDIKYLYAYRGGCLYQPQYRGKRDDVARDECIAARIKYKCDEVSI